MPLIESLDQKALQVPLLLTPGPLTTSASVKETMLVDHGTWDDDYKVLTQSIRQALLAVGHADPELYTSVLMQGSGSFGVEATLQTAVPQDGTLLIAMNGAYGQRMATMATRLGIKHLDLDFGETQIVSAEKVLNVLNQHPEVTHFAMVHSETTTGILNPLTPLIPKLVEMGIVTIVDAMSSFGGVPIDVTQLGVDYLISSANKCIQGVPGFAFVLAKQLTLAATEGNARSLSLDLYDQWTCFEAEAGKWRFTSPTHTVYAFRQALNELIEEGGVAARHTRYAANEKQLRAGMLALGFEPLLPTAVQSPIITSFKYPDNRFDFRRFYESLKQAGFIIYPGKVSKAKTFRIGNIGEIYPEDIQQLLAVIAKIDAVPSAAVSQ
ncbi:2-aminoethylphosphonate--pyruvate transaminase [Lacticaseibacillus porcinae]|uniref:2-aminoethylphosphonate--pyruvate transaminase n=1 Tax=Lacticaseibacillus porcinae TaxID=1123687 RepID=UPI001CDD6A00|nr:2-aminoethylphosphonate--pyruvate transaminase [Lacticaseibacillus porcinae]